MAKEATKSFVLRVDAATMEAVERWAADEFRSTNGQLQWIIMEALRRSGRLKNHGSGNRSRNPKESESMRISFMRWRPGDAGNLGCGKWLEISGVPSRARFRSFVCNRLWIGVLPAFVAGFGIVLLLLVFSRESTPERSLVRASIAGGLCVFGWILGIWAATGPDPEADSNAENPEQASGDRFAPRGLRWCLWVLCGGAAICYAVFSPSIGRIVEGERTVLEGAAEIVSKVLTVVCVIVPVWLAERARR